MVTAQALSRVFDKVTVLERDALLPATVQEGVKRGGVPQYNQPHLMLLKGLAVLESMWPGIRQEFLAAGGNSIKFGRDVHTMYKGIATMRESWGNDDGVSASRALYESTIRRFLLQNPKVTVRPASVVTGLSYDADAKTVTGMCRTYHAAHLTFITRRAHQGRPLPGSRPGRRCQRPQLQC